MIPSAIMLPIVIVCISYAIALRFNLALIALAGALFAAQDWYYFFFKQQELVIESYSLVLMSVTALTALLLMFRRWPMLWIVVTAQIFLLCYTRAIIVDDKAITILFYALCGIALPLLYAFKPRETAFSSAMTEVAASTFIAFGYSVYLLMHQTYHHNKLALKSIDMVLRWVYQLPLNAFILSLMLYLFLSAMAFLCAELLHYLAPAENQPVSYGYFYAALSLCLMALIQPNTLFWWAVMGAPAAYLLLKFARLFNDKRCYWYLTVWVLALAAGFMYKELYVFACTKMPEIKQLSKVKKPQKP